MEARINLITIWTNNLIPMKEFYNKILGFEIENDLGEYVEFKNEGVRFALCLRKVMYNYSEDYKKTKNGQSFELAFPAKSPEDVDKSYNEIVAKGGVPVHEPQNMPWDQRTALFEDPDGNIHEIFSDLK